MIPGETIRPLHDVWLRPRRVFGELAGQPIGRMDFLLGALQGMVVSLAASRSIDAGAVSSLADIFLQAVLFGPLSGIVSLFVIAEIYARLGARAGGASSRRQVIHVLAYGGLPIAASLGLWLLVALLVGEPVFLKAPPPQAEGFVVLMLDAHLIMFMLLILWSVVLQVMGFSEIEGFRTGKALAIWLLGQLLALLLALAGSFLLLKLVSLLAPGALPS